jgi:hypothetical protein
MASDRELRALYGQDVVISRKGRFVLVHLDRPNTQLVRSRTQEFDPEEFFCPDCPLCQMLMESGVIVFDDSLFDELLE